MPENSISHLQSAAPAARALVVAELEFAEAARRASDFARGMVPNGHASRLEPGSLVQDTLRLVDHARQVLAAAIRYEQARDLDDAMEASGADSAVDPTAAGSTPEIHSDAIAERLLELDAWVGRHAEPDDPVASTQPVTDTTTRHVTYPI